MPDVTLSQLEQQMNNRLSDALGPTPLPSYEVDDRKFDWNGYIRAILNSKKDLLELQMAQPFEFSTVYLDPSTDI